MKKILFSILCISISFVSQTFAGLQVGMSFNWNLSGENYKGLRFSQSVKVVDIDAFETSKQTVQKLQSEGKIVIAYISVGSWEPYRDDADDFPQEVVGNIYPGWEDEKILNIRNYGLFSEVLEKRFDMIQAKGFDGIEPDNMGIYGFDEEKDISGFNLNRKDGIEFAKYIAKEAHKRNLFILQKNAPDISLDIEAYFDGALLEDNFYYEEEKNFTNYIKNNKPVFAVEYMDITQEKHFIENICKQSFESGYTAILKQRDLGKYIQTCDYILTDTDKELVERATKKIQKFIERKNISYKKIISLLKKYRDDIHDVRIQKILESIIEKLYTFI